MKTGLTVTGKIATILTITLIIPGLTVFSAFLGAERGLAFYNS